MFTTILLAVLVLVGLGVIIYGLRDKRQAVGFVEKNNSDLSEVADRHLRGYDNDPKTATPFWDASGDVTYVPPILGLIPLVIALILGSFACTTIVEPRSEGVPIGFGKIGETMDSGLNFHAPWIEVTQMDGTNKTSRFVNSKKEDTDNTFQQSAIDVRLADNSESTAYATVRWHRAEDTASDVAAEYRGDDPMEELRDNLVNGIAQSAVVEAMSQYNPTEAIDTLDVDFSDPQAVSEALKTLDLAPDYPALSELAQEEAERLLGDEPLVVFDSIRISKTTMPAKSQARVDAFFTEISDIRVALARRAKNAAQAAAAKELESALTPLILANRCYDLIETGDFKPPVGFQCVSGDSLPLVTTTPAEQPK